MVRYMIYGYSVPLMVVLPQLLPAIMLVFGRLIREDSP